MSDINFRVLVFLPDFGFSSTRTHHYCKAKNLGIHRTVHAGEDGPSVNVKVAVEEMFAERIGEYGFHFSRILNFREKRKSFLSHFSQKKTKKKIYFIHFLPNFCYVWWFLASTIEICFPIWISRQNFPLHTHTKIHDFFYQIFSNHNPLINK